MEKSTHRPDEHLGAKEQNSIETILAYHRRTKHHLHRFAASPGYLDWATQPDPFRTYEGAERVELPLLADRLDVAYGNSKSPALFRPCRWRRISWRCCSNWPWDCPPGKSTGASLGLALQPVQRQPAPHGRLCHHPGNPRYQFRLYHYVSRDHCLERRCAPDARAAQKLAESFPPGSFLVGLSSIHWREAWKYGERAFRYCQHDAGHAIATVRYAAAVLGWSAQLIADISDNDVAAILGLNQPESISAITEQDREHPDALLLIGLSTSWEGRPITGY